MVRWIFLAVMLLLTATLGWLGWRLLAQDQQLADKSLSDQRDSHADRAVVALERRLAGIEAELGVEPHQPAEGAIFVELRPGSIRVYPQDSLLYYPELPQAPEAPSEIFQAADELEHQKRQFSAAIAILRPLAASSDPKVRAAALVRIARNYVHEGQMTEGSRAFEELSRLGSVSVGGMPAALAGRVGVLGSPQAERDLAQELNSGRWKITAAVYRSLASETPGGPRVAIAEAVEWLWENWKGTSGGRSSPMMPAGPVLLVWRRNGDSATAFVGGADYLKSLDDELILLTSPDGSPVVGSKANGPSSIRLASVTGLPWNVQAYDGPDDGEWQVRRRLLIGGMGVLLALILTGSWFVGRSVSRELAVARLQTDFVSAVSHEFRTPLTTLYQLSELLMRGRVATEADRQQYYELLHRESDRLRRLVEALLNFGRLEAGKLQFRLEDLDAALLVRESATEFEQAQQAGGHRVEVQAGSEAPHIRADRETLRCVLWNLFENAVKYSPDCDTVWVELRRKGAQVEIAVRDRGVGIPRGEQKRVFEKFVRGSAARASEVRGTGIGLAMARQIVQAHGGDIQLESEPGQGSTFRVVLPGVEP